MTRLRSREKKRGTVSLPYLPRLLALEEGSTHRIMAWLMYKNVCGSYMFSILDILGGSAVPIRPVVANVGAGPEDRGKEKMGGLFKAKNFKALSKPIATCFL